jgi:hypothetical protein
MAEALEARFIGKKAQFNLSHLEGIGRTARIQQHREKADIILWTIQHEEQLQAGRLKELLAAHLRGFRETFAGVAADDSANEPAR